jgi:hypothetical protein
MTHDPHQPIVAFDEQPDSWHMHTSDEGLPQEEHAAQADPKALVAAFLGSVFFVGGVIVVCLLYFFTHTTKLRQERIETTALAKDYFQYRAVSDKHLATYGWANPEAAAAGKVSIPIDLGMQKVMQQYAGPAPRAEAGEQ